MRDEILKRRDDGQRIRTSWVQQRAIELVEQKDQANVDAFVASDRWLQGFRKRQKLSALRITNRNSLPTRDRLLSLLRFHRALLSLLRAGPRSDPVWGQFLPGDRWNVDQIPGSFSYAGGTTWEQTAKDRVWVKASSRNDTKRMCTYQVAVNAEGRVYGCIIFRGTGKRIPQKEKREYNGRSGVCWQRMPGWTS